VAGFTRPVGQPCAREPVARANASGQLDPPDGELASQHCSFLMSLLAGMAAFIWPRSLAAPPWMRDCVCTAPRLRQASEKTTRLEPEIRSGEGLPH